MPEKLIYLDEIDPITLFGVNNSKFRLLQSFFPKLKLVARGYEIKAIGEKEEIIAFEEKLSLMVEYYNRFNSLNESEIEDLITDEGKRSFKEKDSDDDVLLYGSHGKVIKIRTPNQKKLVDASEKDDLVFTIGPAGSGKTYTAIALAVRALKKKKIKRIILTRPAVEAGENLGFLPGDLKEKLDPYLQPIYDALHDMIPSRKLIEYMDEGTIQIAPLAFMRGRTLSNAFVICDEAQNTTSSQIKMFLTRMGLNTKFIVTGDITQVDLPEKKQSGLVHAIHLLKGIEGITVVEFQTKDIVRHSLVKKIVDFYSSDNPS
jgi:phosphate starvation-inducible PhoH-like protein